MPSQRQNAIEDIRFTTTNGAQGTGTLHLICKLASGNTSYDYFDIPESVYLDFLSSKTPLTYLAREIQPKFTHVSPCGPLKRYAQSSYAMNMNDVTQKMVKVLLNQVLLNRSFDFHELTFFMDRSVSNSGYQASIVRRRAGSSMADSRFERTYPSASMATHAMATKLETYYRMNSFSVDDSISNFGETLDVVLVDGFLCSVAKFEMMGGSAWTIVSTRYDENDDSDKPINPIEGVRFTEKDHAISYLHSHQLKLDLAATIEQTLKREQEQLQIQQQQDAEKRAKEFKEALENPGDIFDISFLDDDLSFD